MVLCLPFKIRAVTTTKDIRLYSNPLCLPFKIRAVTTHIGCKPLILKRVRVVSLPKISKYRMVQDVKELVSVPKSISVLL